MPIKARVCDGLFSSMHVTDCVQVDSFPDYLGKVSYSSLEKYRQSVENYHLVSFSVNVVLD